ncbi:hypothetical protein [Synechococcus sp. CBW1108]|uniref:hypothetical protein n=1 Tax=Synechococcus sp. CBW1108 TaxID=1353147 RepID=UPI0018CD00E3|nr:hypothetical protein [Synechococcus sp. CBW1108]QPN71144.1 hypothetical protein H8F27_06020 [Synechococcus sp. CBW1108]
MVLVSSRPQPGNKPGTQPRWQLPLLVGVCFGLGYGVANRLLALQLPAFVRLGQGFEVRPFPGQSLESLRLQFGTEEQEVRGNLEPLEPDSQPGADQFTDSESPDPAAPDPAGPGQAGPDADSLGLRADPTLPLETRSADSPRASSPPFSSPPSPASPAAAPPPPRLPSPDLPKSTPDAGLP